MPVMNLTWDAELTLYKKLEKLEESLRRGLPISSPETFSSAVWWSWSTPLSETKMIEIAAVSSAHWQEMGLTNDRCYHWHGVYRILQAILRTTIQAESLRTTTMDKIRRT